MLKRCFDVILAIIGGLLLIIPLTVFYVISILDTGKWGVFKQLRVGQYGDTFQIFKLRTMHFKTQRISRFGTFLRRHKLDELPQLLNVIKGEMSIVGPRPDVIGYYDTLKDGNMKVLELKPGLTSRAAIKYWNEEKLLAKQVDPKTYNDEIIFRDKVSLNLYYYYHRSFWEDCKILGITALCSIGLIRNKSY